MLLIIIAVFFAVKASTSNPKCYKYGITITSPREGNHIGIVNVEGTIKRALPTEYTLEILRIIPGRGGGFIPAGRAVPDYKSGTWRASGVDIGGRPGDSRIIGAYLVGPSGRIQFAYFDSANDVLKIARSLAKKEDIYLPPLMPTADMVECAQVGVFRANPTNARSA
jgi:hypothetical protein